MERSFRARSASLRSVMLRKNAAPPTQFPISFPSGEK